MSDQAKANIQIQTHELAQNTIHLPIVNAKLQKNIQWTAKLYRKYKVDRIVSAINKITITD